MPDTHFRAQRSPSPKTSPKTLPPLSKFYYGPAQGWGSAEGSPASYNASTWTFSTPHEQAPALPPRLSPDPPPHSPTQWAKNFPSHIDPAQGWDEHALPALAPPASQFLDSYALMYKASRSPANPTWDSNSPRASVDASRWSVNYQPLEGQKPVPPAKPPLPPRVPQNQDQMYRRPSETRSPSQNYPQSMYSSKQPPSSRVSATTIDVPLFLQPFTYDPETAPPLPRRPSDSPLRNQQSPSGSPKSVPPPQRLPPPPPKIPLDQESDSQMGHQAPQRPRYDPQDSFDDSPRVGQRRPTYDPQDSHESETEHSESQPRHSLQPKIPTPRFTSFNEESALPPPPSESDVVPHSRYSPPKQHKNNNDDRFLAGQRLHQSSISPVNSNDNNRWMPNHNSRWDPHAAHAPSPEPQYATLALRDGSITTTDVSSNRAGLSTPESQQTSNTSNHESVNQADHIRQEQQGDETFYWHSGRSSSDAEEENSQSGSTTATPGQSSVGKGSSIATAASTMRQESLSLPARSSSKDPSPNLVPYGASVLGFGGPSDWEYFGDYEAEEVDDEDLYTRSKAPAELPAESTTIDDVASGEDGVQPKSEMDPQPLPDRSQAHNPTSVLSPRGEILEKSKPDTGDYASTRLRMSSVQSPTRLNNSWNQEDRPISYYQRPDLDDVIRAWSEAPYIGLDRSKEAVPRPIGEEDEVEVDRFPEASLASTPQDKFLGIDLILKNAPEMPKLPDSIDQPSPSLPTPSLGQQKFDKTCSGENLRTDHSSKLALDSKHRFSQQLDPVVEREIEGEEIQLADGPTSNRGSVSHVPESTASESSLSAKPQRTSLCSTGNTGTSNKEEPRGVQVATGSENGHVPPKAPVSARSSKETMNPDAEQASSEVFLATQQNDNNAVDQEQKPQNTSTLQPEKRESKSKSMAEATEPQMQDLHNLEKEELPEDERITRIARPLNIRKFSKEDVHASSCHVLKEVVSAKVSGMKSRENDQDAAPSFSSHSPSEQNVEIPQNASMIDEKQLKAISDNVSMAFNQRAKNIEDPIGDASGKKTGKIPSPTPAAVKRVDIGSEERTLQQDSPNAAKSIERPRGTSAPTSPKMPSSPKIIKVVDPYADLDPWGKASLNRFAAMLREEARVESNREKLNIFNVFTSRESRLRVVLYGSEDELILPPRPAEIDEVEQGPPLQGLKDQKLDHQNIDEREANPEAPVGQTDLHQSSAEQKGEELLPEERKAIEDKVEELTPEEHKAIEDKLAAQMAAEEKSTIDRKPSVPQDQNESFANPGIERSNTVGALKALPALPINRDSVISLPPTKLASLTTHDGAKVRQDTTFGHDAKAIVGSPLDDMQYSPGGRPRIPNFAQGSLEGRIGNGTNRGSKMIDGKPTEPENASVPEARPRPRPKIKDGESEVNNYLTNRRSVYRPFATQTLETMESSSNFGRQPDINIDSTPMPLLRAPSSKFSAATQATKEAENLPELVTQTIVQVPITNEQSDKRRSVQTDFDPLLLVLPEGEVKVCASNRLQDLKDILEAIPEDFSFIHASVVAWDAQIRVQRETNDKLRHERQAESEKRIDSLFDDHEIGYGDISELEAEFKRSEAARKADEDRSEYQTFVSDVFDLVWTRLHYELDQLVPHYECYSIIMDETLAGKEAFDNGEDGLALAPTMTQFLALHQKIEIRHQKAFEAVLERDRRLKKTEISPWYTLNNIPKVKQLEKQFEDAEKRAIIEYCEQRDGRANQLMDVLDQNTLRGVGANQDYMETIMKAVRRIASSRAFDFVPGMEGAAAGLEEVQKAQTLTALLATSSEQIVQTFHVADMLLNSADYEVSVAKAKVAKVDMATLARLKEERAKEDQKLMRDLEHRLALIREDSRRTNDEIIKLMLFLGVQHGRAVETTPRALGVHMRGGSLEAAAVLDMQAGPVNDTEHQERMKKALEEAKRRNALKESG